MKKIYNKLIRDEIPAVIDKKGVKYSTRVADDKEYEEKLLEKLKEEIEEFSRDQNQEQMADIWEVLNAICDLKGFRKEGVENIRKKKFAERGSFSKKLILEETEG